MTLLEAIKHILFADSFVSKHKAEDEHRNQRGIGLIAAAAFAIMSLLNIKQGSLAMLATTGSSSVLLIIGYFLSKYKNNFVFLRVVFYFIFILLFTSYTIMGGNEGFAVLWLIIATYAVMITIDFKAGLVISFYYLVMLIMVFIGPLTPLLQYDYNKTFMLRFPFLYAINFAFATYIVVRVRTYQYKLLMKQQELEHLSIVDLSTGLLNRNYFIQNELASTCDNLKTLSGVFIDVNGLHEVNNSHGHDAGDKMLCAIADLCKEYFPKDSIYRMGGDEFLILCKDAEENAVRTDVQKLFDAVEQMGYSISYGIDVQTDQFNLDELVKKADAEMIAFKKDYYQRTNRKSPRGLTV